MEQRARRVASVDSQQLLTWDNLTTVGAYNDMDMLENCNSVPGSSKHSQTAAEYRSQFATFAVLTSPLILGNDPRNMSKSCIEIVINNEVIALNQDPLVSRARMVYTDTVWPGMDAVPPNGSAYPAPAPHYAAPKVSLQVFAKPLHTGAVGVVVLNRATHVRRPLT